MARLHSNKKGKAGTKRPKAKVAPEFSKVEAQKVKEIILKLNKEGVPMSKIGLTLRDEYAVPSVRALIGSSVSAFLKNEAALPEYPEDILTLIKKAVSMRSHLKTTTADTHNKVKLLHVESKINRLGKYYVSKNRLPKGWRYDPESAALLVK